MFTSAMTSALLYDQMINVGVALMLCGFFTCSGGLSCSSTIGYLNASQSAQFLMSPGYPTDYENNQNCRWLISSHNGGKRIQVEIISVNIANWDGGECEDYLEIREGRREDSPLIKKWCSSTDLFQFLSKGQHILVKFVSDHHITAPGFVLKYYQMDEYTSKCDPYQVRTISIGEHPVFLDLPMYTDRLFREISCDYHLRSQFNDDVVVNVELLTFSEILCEDGSFVVHDGPSDDFPTIIDWCYHNQPFHHLTSSGKDMFIRFRLINSETDWLVFRAKATIRLKSISCSEKSIPNLEVKSTPTYFAFPQQHRPASPRSCPLRLWAEKQTQTIRLEVISPDPPCANRGAVIYNGYDLASEMIGSLCDRTIFSSSTHNLVLSPINDNNTAVVFLKASAIEATCNGKVERRKADYDEVNQLPELANPKTGYAYDLNCTYLLEPELDSDVIEVSVRGRMVASDMFLCEHDYVTFYNGNSTSSPVIDKWCGAKSQAHRFVSKGPSMLVVVTTDSFNSFDGVKITYYAVPRTGGCSLVMELEANSTFQYLKSPNYPLYYPINSYCEYRVVAPEEHFVLFEVLHSSLENDCSDTVRVYNGLEKKYDKYLGRWCGDEKPKYRSEGRELLIVFSADDKFNSGGFNARFYATKDSKDDYLIPAIVGSIIFALAVAVFIVFVICLYMRRRKRNQSTD